MEKCPVCGMNVDKGAADTSDYEGRIYRFCSPECKETFQEDPQRFVGDRVR